MLEGHPTALMETLHLCGATGRSRTEMRDGKEYLVVPVVALMEGVIHPVNASTAEFVPFSTLKRAATSWNGRPVTVGHPTRNGKQCSANDPSIFESHVIGTIFESHTEGKKLLQEAWLEKDKTKRLQPQMFADLEANKPVEVSVGTFVVAGIGDGEFGSKKYKATWLDASGDHLAMLPGGRGACSIEMGCGTHRSAAMRMLEDRMELETLGGPGSGPHKGDGGEKRFTVTRASGYNSTEAMGHHDSLTSAKNHANDDAHRTGQKNVVHDRKTGTIVHDTGKRGRGDQVYHGSSMVGKSSNLPKIVGLEGTLETLDTPAEAAAEEAAELVGYTTLRTLFDQVQASVKSASNIIDELISDETDDPTETAAEEDSEEEVETARLNAFSTLCRSTIGSLSACISLAYELNAEDINESPMSAAAKKVECAMCKGTGSKDGNPCEACDGEGMLKVAAGARHSSADMKMIQTMHDHTAALGAACSRTNLETASSTSPGLPPIKHEGGKYVLYSQDGRRKLAEHGTLKDAEAHAKAIVDALTRRAS